MEGPLLVLKSWALTALAIWVYKRWFQRVAPPTPEFEAFCRTRPVVAALFGLNGNEQQASVLLASRLGKARASVATLGGFPWPHYRLELAIETARDAVLVRVDGADVVRSGQRELPALASVLRDVLNELPADAQGWLHAGAFNNGLVDTPEGGWSMARGREKHPRVAPLRQPPECVEAARARASPTAADLCAADEAGQRLRREGGVERLIDEARAREHRARRVRDLAQARDLVETGETNTIRIVRRAHGLAPIESHAPGASTGLHMLPKTRSSDLGSS
jgi:hypothetical protein